MNEKYLVKSISELRKILGEPNARLSEKITNQIDTYQNEYITKAPIVFVSTCDLNGIQEVSPKGDDAGFVKVLNETTLLIPERPGNKLAFGFENILRNENIGLIFVVPGVIETLRVSGTAQISKDPALLSELSAQEKPALLCTVVTVKKCWFHCGKAFIRSKLWKPEYWLENAKSNYSQQVSDAIGVDTQLVERIVEEDYKNNLY